MHPDRSASARHGGDRGHGGDDAERRGRARSDAGTTQDVRFVSARFLSDFFPALARQDVPVADLIGDLPIPLGERGEVREPVEWDHFVEFMRRLGRVLGGPAGLERCGGLLGQMKPARALSSLAGFAASPHALYRAASGWVLRRAMPGLEASLRRAADGQLEIHAKIAEGLRPCPELFHFAIGGARILPRTIGLADAVVVAEIGEREARYRIAVPPSTTLWSRVARVFKAIFSAGDVLRFLEAQQLELHAKNEDLRRANQALAESEARYRAIVDTAVDVLCELDRTGRVVYVSASIERLIGYSPEQVIGSHYRLWIPREWHERVDEVVDALFDLPSGRATQEVIRLHGAGGQPVFAELTARTYDTRDGERRIVAILRDQTDRAPIAATPSAETKPGGRDARANAVDIADVVARAIGEDASLRVGHAIGEDVPLRVEHDDGVAVAPRDAEKDED